jgi:hypothetical protein
MLDDFHNAMNRVGFSEVEFFSDLEFTVFNKELSKDLIIRAIKE